MSRQPFITGDLRPDMGVEDHPEQQGLDSHATTTQLAAAALVLSENERQHIERSLQQKMQSLMQCIPRPNENVQGTGLDGETVLLDLNTGRYYTLNRIGTAIWEGCTGTHSLGQIHAALCERYDASAERIADDLLALVTRLSHEGLLTLERG